MRRCLSVAPVLLGIFCLFWATGCPPGVGSGIPANQVEMSYRAGFEEGFLAAWFKDHDTKDPEKIEFGPLGSGLTFNGFQPWAGTFSINTDFQGPNEFQFNVVGMSPTSACVDFDGNKSCEASDIRLNYNTSMRMLTVTNPYGGMVVSKGRYALNLEPGTVGFKGNVSSIQDFEVPMTMTLGSESWKYQLLLPHNVAVYPHVPVGTYQNLEVIPTFQINNVNGSSTNIQTNFYTDKGMPRNVKIGSYTGVSFPQTLMGKSGRSFSLEDSVPLQGGWAYTQGSGKTSGSEIFRTYSVKVNFLKFKSPVDFLQDGVELIAEAGISAAKLSTCHVIEVTKTADGFDTGIAVVNPTSVDGTLDLVLKDSNDNMVQENPQFSLKSMNQVVKFAAEFFPGFNPDSFSGTLVIRSNTTIAVSSLNTFKLLQGSSLPSGTADDR